MVGAFWVLNELFASHSNPDECWVAQGLSCSASQGFCQRQGGLDKEM